MGIEAFEHGAVGLVGEQLRFAVEVGEVGGRAKLLGHGVHEGRSVAVSALVPVVVGPGVADRPLVFFGQEGFERLHRRR